MEGRERKLSSERANLERVCLDERVMFVDEGSLSI